MAAVQGEAGYGTGSKLFHWLVFILIAAQFGIAWTMPDIGRGTLPQGLIAWHLWLGTLILLVVAARLLWRLTHAAPPPPATLPAWQRALSRLTHFVLYLILAVEPVLGWGNASSRGWDVSLFGLFKLPALFEQGSKLGHSLGDIHSALATVLLILVGLHTAAALYHHFLARDGILLRMLPQRRRG